MDTQNTDTPNKGTPNKGESPLPPERVEWWRKRVTHFPEARAVLLPLLHDLQDHVGCLTREALRWAADFVGITPTEVCGVATFYWMYEYEPRARRQIAVCHNISCDLRGKDQVLEAIRDELGLAPGQRKTDDGEWSLRTVECMGSCTTAPMMAINGEYFENLDPAKTRAILEEIRSGKHELPASPETFAPHPEVVTTYEHEEAKA